MGQLASRGWEAEMKQARWAGRVWKVGGTQGTGRGAGGHCRSELSREGRHPALLGSRDVAGFAPP